MRQSHRILLCAALAASLTGLRPPAARAEILAMMNYESKPKPVKRREGIAIIDVDPNSPDFGRIIRDIPLPPDLVAHHIFYNRDHSKAYVTALGQSVLYVMDMKKPHFPIRKVAVEDCKVGEDIVFSGDNKTWYLTCMGSSTVIVGDAVRDRPIRTLRTPRSAKAFIKYPHGIAIHEGIDRMIVTTTVRHDLKHPGETVTVLQASTGKVLSTHKLSNKPSPSGEAPVEVLFRPNANPPMAYITNMFGGTLWSATWNPAKKAFDFRQVFDFAPLKAGVPLEIYFNGSGNRLYVTTAKPGHLHIFDIGRNPAEPRLLKTIPAAGGAHHVAFTRDWRYAFVQNSLLNLPGMNDGSVTVIDLKKEKVVARVDTLKNRGLAPNCIVLLPRWNHLAGH